LFGFVCLAVLVVVTSLNDESALTTVALALAILAFAVQLIVFVVQYRTSSEQGRRSEELHGALLALLAEIKEKAATMQADVRRIDEKMLEGLMAKQAADPAAAQIPASQLIRQATVLGGDSGGIGVPLGPRPAGLRGGVIVDNQLLQWPQRRPSPDDDTLRQKLETYPAEDEVGDTMDVLNSLSDEERMNLKAFGEDEIINRRPGAELDPALSDLAAGGLEEKGLVEPYPADRQPPGDRVRFMHLTERGRDVARLLSAITDPPVYLPNLKEIRATTPERIPGYQAAARR
jgi:hypothetical protein